MRRAHSPHLHEQLHEGSRSRQPSVRGHGSHIPGVRAGSTAIPGSPHSSSSRRPNRGARAGPSPVPGGPCSSRTSATVP